MSDQTPAGLSYAQRINRAIDHILANVAEKHSLDDLARIACFSKFHFHRIFKSHTGETLNQFVKRVRLEKAVGLLRQNSGSSITEIGMKVGFDSPTDFSRSFKQQYGFSPKQFTPERFREESKICKELAANVHYPLRSQETASNPDHFEVRVEAFDAFPIAYVRVIGAFDPQRILDGMNHLIDWARPKGLYPNSRLIGMSPDDMDITPIEKYRYDWAIRVPESTHVEDRVSLTSFRGGPYATIHCVGDIALLDRAWQFLFQQWLPASGYEPDDAPSLEWYETDPIESGWEQFNLKCCLPVRKS